MNGYFATPRGAHPIGSVLNLFAGIWLCISPLVMAFTGRQQATWNTLLVGAGVVILAVIRLSGSARLQPLSWLNVALGVWLIVSPAVLGYGSVPLPRWNDVIVGIVVSLLGLWSALTPQFMVPVRSGTNRNSPR